MPTLEFRKATKTQARARIALVGPSGSGKTWTALTIAAGLGKRVAVIDTERGSASKYADSFAFDTLALETFSPDTYTEAIHVAEAAGYDVIVIDSLSHAWTGREGALEQVDKAAARSQSKNTYFAWRDVTPKHNALIDAMIGSRCHIVATMRSKTEYVIETDSKGKQVPRKIGLAAVQREGMEYEFDIVADMDMDHNFIVSKSRCTRLADAVINRPDAKLPAAIAAWLSDGAAEAEALASAVPGAVATTIGSNGNGQHAALIPVGEDLATVKTESPANFLTSCDKFAALVPWYAKADRSADLAHILRDARALGFASIDSTNWKACREKLNAHAREAAARQDLREAV